MLTAELSKLGLTNAELFLGLHSDHELGCLVTDLRKPVEAEGVLTWSTGTPTLTVQHIAAALETAWQMSIVSMSQEDQSHCKKLCSLCSLQPDALTPHRNITELSMPQHILETCRNAVATFYRTELADEPALSHFKLFSLSADGKHWKSSDITEAHIHSGYASNAAIDKYMACAVLGGSNNLDFMRGYTSQLGCHCYNFLMCDIDDNHDC